MTKWTKNSESAVNFAYSLIFYTRSAKILSQIKGKKILFRKFFKNQVFQLL
jgi:hypothetical protein